MNSPVNNIRLNDEQDEAANCFNKHLLIVAGAGTGKTRTIIERIKNILQQSLADFSQVLAVTFTNKAAGEMKNRLFEVCKSQERSNCWIGTFHSIAVRILRAHAELLGLENNFVIFDLTDQLSTIKRIIGDEKLDLNDKNNNPRFILQIIQSWKDKFIGPEKSAEHAFFAEKHIVYIYQKYQERLRNANALDFGDLLFFLLKLFREHAEILKFYQEKFKFITVDEFQDTNYIQYQIIKKLITDNNNLCCVGDDDQSIYSWRGAQIGNIMNFKKDFAQAKIIKIEQNYRSTNNILNAADSIISHNKDRIRKKVWTKKEGDKIKIVNLYTGYDEAKFLAEEVKKLKENKQIWGYKNTAILIRSNAQSRLLEECFTQVMLPYEIVGGVKFYNRQEVKDMISYLRLLINPLDSTAFERIVNRPRRKFGEQSLNKLQELSRENNVSMMEALSVDSLEAEKLRDKLSLFMQSFKQWNQDREHMAPDSLTQKIFEESGYKMWLMTENEPAYVDEKLENVKELINAVERFDKLEDFLEHIALMSTICDDDGVSDSVKIMTFHAAKGLEFDYVFLPGWEENVFPNYRVLEEGNEEALQEERRLAYVGITRAKKNAYITYVNLRHFQGNEQSAKISRFVEEINPKFADFMDLSFQAKQKYQHYLKKKSTTSNNKFQKYQEQKKLNQMIIRHKVFGDGKVIEKRGKVLTILFESGVTKKITSEFVEFVES